MTFQKRVKETITETINIEIPGDHGKTENATIAVTLKQNPNSVIKERKAKIDKNARRHRDEPSDPTITDEEILRQDVTNVTGMIDTETNAEIPFDPDLLEWLLELPYVVKPMMYFWVKVNHGEDALKEMLRKNV